jgi:hypothetical protein
LEISISFSLNREIDEQRATELFLFISQIPSAPGSSLSDHGILIHQDDALGLDREGHFHT